MHRFLLLLRRRRRLRSPPLRRPLLVLGSHLSFLHKVLYRFHSLDYLVVEETLVRKNETNKKIRKEYKRKDNKRKEKSNFTDPHKLNISTLIN